MKKILILLMTVIIIFSILQDNAYAVYYTLSDAKSCTVIGANPSFDPNTCIITVPLVLNAYDMLSIDKGMTLIVEGSITNAGGTIINSGILKNFNTIYNIGFIGNTGTIINSATITNYDTIWNSCSGLITGNIVRNIQPDSHC